MGSLQQTPLRSFVTAAKKIKMQKFYHLTFVKQLSSNSEYYTGRCTWWRWSAVKTNGEINTCIRGKIKPELLLHETCTWSTSPTLVPFFKKFKLWYKKKPVEIRFSSWRLYTGSFIQRNLILIQNNSHATRLTAHSDVEVLHGVKSSTLTCLLSFIIAQNVIITDNAVNMFQKRPKE